MLQKKSLKKYLTHGYFLKRKLFFFMLKNPINREKANKNIVKFWCNEIGIIE